MLETRQRELLIAELALGSQGLTARDVVNLAGLIERAETAMRVLAEWERRGVWDTERAEYERATAEAKQLADQAQEAIAAAGWSPPLG